MLARSLSTFSGKLTIFLQQDTPLEAARDRTLKGLERAVLDTPANSPSRAAESLSGLLDRQAPVMLARLLSSFFVMLASHVSTSDCLS
jgi:hypothetical protein